MSTDSSPENTPPAGPLSFESLDTDTLQALITGAARELSDRSRDASEGNGTVEPAERTVKDPETVKSANELIANLHSTRNQLPNGL